MATPPLLAAGAQVTYDEADATDVEVAVSELIKENMYHVKRWWERPEELLYDARGGSLRLPSDDKLAAMMQEAGVRAVTPVAPRRSYASQSSSKSTQTSKYDQTEALDAHDFEVESPSNSKSSLRSSESGGSSPSSFIADDTRTRDEEREAMPSDDTYEPYAPTSYSTAASDAGPEESGGVTRSEAAAQQAAGIIRTESAFEYGKTLWTQAWGMAKAQNVPVTPAVPASIDPHVAAVGVDDYPNSGYPDQQYPAEQQYPVEQYPAEQQYPAQPQYGRAAVSGRAVSCGATAVPGRAAVSGRAVSSRAAVPGGATAVPGRAAVSGRAVPGRAAVPGSATAVPSRAAVPGSATAVPGRAAVRFAGRSEVL